MKKIIVIASLLFQILSLFSDDLNWVTLNRNLDLEIDPGTQFIQGSADLSFINLSNTDSISLDFWGLTVDSVVSPGGNLSFYRVGDTLDTLLIIDLNQTFFPDDTMELSVYYQGYPFLIPGPLWLGGLRFYSNVIFSIHAPNGLKAWMPCLDHHRHKAWVNQNYTVPDTMFVMSNGLLDSVVNLSGNRKKYCWRETRKLIPYIQGVAISNYAIRQYYIDTIPVMIATFPQDSANAVYALRRLDSAYQVYTQRYGPYPYCKIAYAEVILPGGMQNQDCILVGVNQFNGSAANERLLMHEFAHMWWGDYVSPLDFGEVWLPEGWAVFSEGIFSEYVVSEAFMHAYMHQQRNEYLDFERNNGYYATHNPPYEHFYSELTYERPCAMIYALRFALKDSLFFETTKEIMNVWGDSNAQWQDVSDVFTNVTGRDMTWFFDQWLNGTGTPDMYYEYYQSSSGADSSMVFAWTTSPTSTDFKIEIPLHFYLNGNPVDTLIAVADADSEYSYFSVNCDSFRVDPDSTQFVKSRYRVNCEIIATIPQDQSVIVTWTSSNLPNVNGYNVYAAEYPSLNYQKMNVSLITDTIYTVTSLANNQPYAFYVTHQVQNRWESYPSDTSMATPASFPFDRNLLIVDESEGGSGVTPIMPTDQQFDSAYQEIFQGYVHDVYHCDGSLPDLSYLGHYRQVFWHSDEYISTSQINEAHQLIKSYVTAGGHLIISGWRVYEGLDSNLAIFFGLDSAVLVYDPEFSMAEGWGSFPDVHIDSSLMQASWNGKMSRGMYLVTGSAFDTLAVWGPGSAYQGKIVTLKVNQNLILNCYPLYFVENADARSFVQSLVGVEENISQNPLQDEMLVRYSSPYQIEFVLPASIIGQELHFKVYDVSGRQVYHTHIGEKVKLFSWNWTENSGVQVANGSYFVIIQSNNYQFKTKIFKLI